MKLNVYELIATEPTHRRCVHMKSLHTPTAIELALTSHDKVGAYTADMKCMSCRLITKQQFTHERIEKTKNFVSFR